MFRLWQGSRTPTCQSLHRITSNLWKKGAAPGGAPASLSAFGLTPLPHSCHGFGLRPNSASPFFSQPLSCLCAPFGAGFPCPCQFGRVGKTFSHCTPKMPGRRKPHALIPQTPPNPPPEPDTLGFSSVARSGGRLAATLRGKWDFQTLELSPKAKR